MSPCPHSICTASAQKRCADKEKRPMQRASGVDVRYCAAMPFTSTPGRIRTCNQRIRNPLLYPLSYGRKMLCLSGLSTFLSELCNAGCSLQYTRVYTRKPNPGMSVILKTTTKRPAGKVGKPRATFPFFAHVRGYWAKKVRGRLVHFGKVADDPKRQAALDTWLEQKDDFLAGRTPTANGTEARGPRHACRQFVRQVARSPSRRSPGRQRGWPADRTSSRRSYSRWHAPNRRRRPC